MRGSPSRVSPVRFAPRSVGGALLPGVTAEQPYQSPGYTIPDDVAPFLPSGSAEQHSQAGLDTVELTVLRQGIAGFGVANQQSCLLLADGATLTLTTSAGSVLFGANTLPVITPPGSCTVIPDPTNPCWAIVFATPGGAISLVTGTPSPAVTLTTSGPVFPQLPAGTVALWAIYVNAAATAVSQTDLVDLRVIVPAATPFIPSFMGGGNNANDGLVLSSLSTAPGGAILRQLPTYQLGRLLGIGHSYGSGYAPGSQVVGGGDPFAKLSQMLGNNVRNMSIAGSLLAWDELAGANTNDGWSKVAQSVVPPATVGPDVPVPNTTILLTGINDLGIGKTLTAYTQAVRYVLSRSGVSRVFEDTDASVTYPTGTWATTTSNGLYGSGTSVHTLSTATGSIQIAVPADFEGGAIALCFMAWPGYTGGLTFTIDGAAATPTPQSPTSLANLTHTGGNQAHFNGVCIRFTGLSPGAHTVVGSLTGVATSAYFDCWQIEGNPALPMYVCNVPHVLPAGYANAAYAAAPVPTDALVSAWNVALSATLTEFPNAILVDIDSALHQSPTLFASDGLHPNQRGYAAIASKLADAITGSSLTSMQAALMARSPINVNRHQSGFALGSADIALTATAFTDLLVGTGQTASVTLAAEVGDEIEFWFNGYIINATTATIGFDVMSYGGAVNRYWSNETTSPFIIGITQWFVDSGAKWFGGPPVVHTVQVDELLLGTASYKVRYVASAAAGRTLSQASVPIRWLAKNLSRQSNSLYP